MVKWSRGRGDVMEAPRASAAVTEVPAETMRLGDLLVSRLVLTPEILEEALSLQNGSGRKLGSILLERGLLDAGTLTQALAVQVGLPTVDLRRIEPSAEALGLLEEVVARR